MQHRTPSLSVVIPVYNNEKTLRKQLDACLRYLEKMSCVYEIIVADDCSSDATDRMLQEYKRYKPIRLYRHAQNKGIAENLKFLYGKAKLNTILLFSIDGDWNPADIPRLKAAVTSKHADIVIGKRDKRVYPLTRRVISYVYNLFPKLLFGVSVIDAGSIKIFKREVYRKQTLTSSSVFFEAEFIMKAAKMGYTITEIPITFTRKNKQGGTGGHLKNLLPAIFDVFYIRYRGL